MATTLERNREVVEERLLSSFFDQPFPIFLKELIRVIDDYSEFVPSLDFMKILVLRFGYESTSEFNGYDTFPFNNINEAYWPDSTNIISYDRFWENPIDLEDDEVEWAESYEGDPIVELNIEGSSIFPNGLMMWIRSDQDTHTVSFGQSVIIRTLMQRIYSNLSDMEDIEDLGDFILWVSKNPGNIFELLTEASVEFYFSVTFELNTLKTINPDTYRYLRNTIYYQLDSYVLSLQNRESNEILYSLISDLELDRISEESGDGKVPFLKDLLVKSKDLSELENSYETRLERNRHEGGRFIDLDFQDKSVEWLKIFSEFISVDLEHYGPVVVINALRIAISNLRKQDNEFDSKLKYDIKFLESVGKFLLFGDHLDPRPFHLRLGNVYEATDFSNYKISKLTQGFRKDSLVSIFEYAGISKSAYIVSLGCADFWTELDLIRAGYKNVIGREISEVNIEAGRERLRVWFSENEPELSEEEMEVRIGGMISKGSWDTISEWDSLNEISKDLSVPRVFLITGRSLSHEEDPLIFEQTLKVIYSMMRPGDILIFDLPNPSIPGSSYYQDIQSFRERVRLLSPEVRTEDLDILIDGPDNINLYNRYAPNGEKVVGVLENVGFEIVDNRGNQSLEEMGEFVVDINEDYISEKILGHDNPNNQNMMFVCRKPYDAPDGQGVLPSVRVAFNPV